MSIGIRNLDIRNLIASKMNRTLPAASGPFSVGFCDVEYQSPTEIDSVLKNTGNIYLRLFYPSSSKMDTSPLKRPLWIADPRYVSGYLNFVGISKGFGIPLISALFGQVRLPCVENGDVVTTDACSSLPPTPMPVILFSHGLGGMRTSYSYVCYELASYGFVVASFEHLDGTASVAFTHGGRNKIPYNYSYADINKGRQIQLRHREGEIKKAFELLSGLQLGSDHLKLYDLESLKFIPLGKHSSKSKLRTTLEQFKGKLDLSTVFLCGHSFGATAAIETAFQMSVNKSESDIGESVKAVLAFDPWMVPAGKHLFKDPLSRPTLVVNSHSFHDKSSINKLHRLFRIETNNPQDFAERESKIITITNTGHHAHTDLPLILPSQIRLIPGLNRVLGSLDPKLALNLITKASREFVSIYLPDEWRKVVVDRATIFQTKSNRRPKEIVIGTSFNS